MRSVAEEDGFCGVLAGIVEVCAVEAGKVDVCTLKAGIDVISGNH